MNLNTEEKFSNVITSNKLLYYVTIIHIKKYLKKHNIKKYLL